MAQALKTLFGALQASPYITSNGITMIFGAEEVTTQRYRFPAVNMVPMGGPYDAAPGYTGASLDPFPELLWETAEQIDFWIYNASTDLSAQGSVDHADAIESTRQYLVSALRDQQAQYTDVANVAYGLNFKIVSGRWEVLANNAPSRYGRAYVLTVIFKITVAMAPPSSPEATITAVSTSTTVVDKAPT